MKLSYMPIILLTIALMGCAPKVPIELSDARAAYLSASKGPAAILVPSDLHKAQEALNDAEVAFRDDPKSYHTLDLAYVALRKAELASVLAVRASESITTENANAQYQSTQDAIMQNTKAQLGSTKSDLAASQTAGARSEAELSASKSDLAASQTAGARSEAALAASQTAGARTEAELSASQSALATSEAARVQAEQRAADTLAALTDLAAVKEEARGLVITLSGSVLFRSDDATLLPSATAKLGKVTEALRSGGEPLILVEGHSDSQGSDAHNLDLSQRRADAVRSFMMQQGYDPSRVRAVGIGEARPVADNDNAEGRANNRRVEIVVSPVAMQ